MDRLITKSTVAAKLQIAIGYDDAEFNSFIDQAQEFDLKPLLPENFYYDLVAGRASDPYKKLIDGGAYAYDARNYDFQGLASVLAYFTYARFVMNSSAVSTSHGIVVKKTPVSEPLPIEERKNIYYAKRGEAKAMFDDVRKYIDRNISLFPSWSDGSCSSSGNTGPTTTKVIQ